MYLHLGRDTVVAARDVVGIVDARVATVRANRALLERAIAGGRLRREELKACKALVVTVDGVYASAISPQSLARRLRTRPI